MGQGRPTDSGNGERPGSTHRFHRLVLKPRSASRVKTGDAAVRNQSPADFDICCASASLRQRSGLLLQAEVRLQPATEALVVVGGP